MVSQYILLEFGGIAFADDDVRREYEEYILRLDKSIKKCIIKSV
jgi:hypothetical protein